MVVDMENLKIKVNDEAESKGIIKTRFVKGFDNYIVSNLGDVYSVARKGNWSGRFIKSSANHKGYARVTLSNNGIKKTLSLHRVVLDSFTDDDCNKEQVNHINGLKLDNRLVNLEWCTSSQNVVHAYTTGLAVSAKGTQKSLLSEQDVLDIVYRYKSGEQLKEISKSYPVSSGALSSIVTGRSWSHVTGLKVANVWKGYKAC